MADIIRVFREDIPPLRFIGRRYPDFGPWWGEWFSQGLFDRIEAAAGGSERILTQWENGGGYLGVERRGEGIFEYLIGMLVPAGTEAPEGFITLDLEGVALGTCWLRGLEDEVHDTSRCRAAVENAGMRLWHDAEGMTWSFENCLCPRFTTPDAEGKVILDYCWVVEK